MAVGATMIPDPLARLDVHASRTRKPSLPKWTTIALCCAGPHGHSLSLQLLGDRERPKCFGIGNWGQKPKWPEVAPIVVGTGHRRKLSWYPLAWLLQGARVLEE